MFFHKTERAMQLQKRRNEELGIKTAYEAEELDLEKGDIPAMLISAFLTIFPVAILALALVAGIPMLIYWLFTL